MSVKTKTSPESIVREIKRKTRRKFTAEEKLEFLPYNQKKILRIRIGIQILKSESWFSFSPLSYQYVLINM